MKIRVLDDLNPEDNAMLQALYSRSASSVDEHIAKVKRVGSGKFMQSYYVGYGHQSIGDCGSTTIFIEDVSLLAAKAIQNSPMYSGQETSTRYINMAEQRIEHPFGPEGDIIMDRWMSFYRENLDEVVEHVKNGAHRKPDEDPAVYDRAVKARAFDIMRGFLPAGITTQLSWHTNLRQAKDHLSTLIQHPLLEVRRIAIEIAGELASRYPSSGFDMKIAEIVGPANLWRSANNWFINYPAGSSLLGDGVSIDIDEPLRETISSDADLGVGKLLRSRPRGAVLPHFLSSAGLVHLDFDLDFGSFRDLQRHRNGVVGMPVLTPQNFEPWYLDQLPAHLASKANRLIDDQLAGMFHVNGDQYQMQYLCALGFQVPCHVTMALPALVYFLELRSSKTVHPTLRKQVLAAIEGVREDLPDLVLHVDTDPDNWTVRRGHHTITEKEAVQ